MAKHRKRNPRLESLSKQIARILHNDIQRNGPLEVPQKTYPTARDLLRMPQAEREAYMEQSFAAVADEDIELFEAFDEADFDDEYEYTD